MTAGEVALIISVSGTILTAIVSLIINMNTHIESRRLKKIERYRDQLNKIYELLNLTQRALLDFEDYYHSYAKIYSDKIQEMILLLSELNVRIGMMSYGKKVSSVSELNKLRDSLSKSYNEKTKKDVFSIVRECVLYEIEFTSSLLPGLEARIF